MTIRAYHWDDPGAPELPNDSSQRLIDNLRLILKACLVDGYGDKPGAGWTLGHDLPDGFSLGNGRGWLNVVAGSSYNSVTVYILEEITDFSTPLASGVNRRSGRLSDGYTSNYLTRPSSLGFSGTSRDKVWSVVADDRTATLMGMGGNTSVDPPTHSTILFHFGEYISPDESPGFLALCGNEATASGGVYSSFWTGSGGMVLRNPFTGLVDQGDNPDYKAGLATVSSVNLSSISNNYILPRLTRLPLCRAGLVSGNLQETGELRYPTPSGTLRGVMYIPHIAGMYSKTVLSGMFGIENPTFEDKFKQLPNILQPDHPGLYMAYPNTSDLGAFLSLDPKDWE